MTRVRAAATASLALLLCPPLLGSMAVSGNRLTIDTSRGRVVIDRGVIVSVENKLTGETYTAPGAGTTLTGLLWYGRKQLIDEDAEAQTTVDEGGLATITAKLP